MNEEAIRKNMAEIDGRGRKNLGATVLNIQSEEEERDTVEEMKGYTQETSDNSPIKKVDADLAQVTPLPLVNRGVYSLVSDMKLGWKPQNDKKASYLSEVPPVIAFKYITDPSDTFRLSQ